MKIEPYTRELSDACVALERACPQGEAFRLSFRRRQFHLRAQCYDEARILVAREGERVVGTVAWAVKDLIIRGEPRRAGFYFDLRVHPDFRGRGIAKRLGEEAVAAGQVTMRYGYCVEDNRVSRHIVALHGGAPVGGYRYLIWPIYRPRPVRGVPSEALPRDVHVAQVEANGPFDFYCDPTRGGRLTGHVLSLLGDGAGCSVWSNAELLQEVVERIPFRYRVARPLARLWPFATPHIPRSGELVRSWYVYDFFARDAERARDLMRHVNNLALDRMIQYCSVVAPGRPDWFEALRSDTPSWCSPVIPYVLLVTGVEGRLERPYVDIRDL
ncbi:MAG: GNAT family N-acetyltransferase [Planctomycetes bacterium]|nr:GNAT family N-acetyltransferase [Planctomycetota bacterium]